MVCRDSALSTANHELKKQFVATGRAEQAKIAQLEQWFNRFGISMVDPATMAKAEADQKNKVESIRRAASRMLAEATKLLDEAAALEKMDPMIAWNK